MTSEDALLRLKAILGKGLHPTAIPRVKEVLTRLEGDSFEDGFEQAKETVTEWHEPKPIYY